MYWYDYWLQIYGSLKLGFLLNPQIMVASNIEHMKPYSIVIDERIIHTTVPYSFKHGVIFKDKSIPNWFTYLYWFPFLRLTDRSLEDRILMMLIKKIILSYGCKNRLNSVNISFWQKFLLLHVYMRICILANISTNMFTNILQSYCKYYLILSIFKISFQMYWSNTSGEDFNIYTYVLF